MLPFEDGETHIAKSSFLTQGDWEQIAQLKMGKDHAHFLSSIALVESQFGSSNMSTGWDRRTGLVLFLEAWLRNDSVVQGV